MSEINVGLNPAALLTFVEGAMKVKTEARAIHFLQQWEKPCQDLMWWQANGTLGMRIGNMMRVLMPKYLEIKATTKLQTGNGKGSSRSVTRPGKCRSVQVQAFSYRTGTLEGVQAFQDARAVAGLRETVAHNESTGTTFRRKLTCPVQARLDTIKAIDAFIGYDHSGDFASQLYMAEAEVRRLTGKV